MSNDMNHNVPIEYIMARYMVRYARLNQLISYAFKGSNANTINLYVDIYSMYKTIISRTYRTDMSNYTEFVSSLINLCAHYRGYFKSLGVYVKIYLVSSYNIPEYNIKYFPNYNSTFREKLNNKSATEIISLDGELLDLICPYLPGIYFFRTNFESSVFMNHLIKNNKENNPNIILTTDLYPIQLCYQYDNTVLLKPYKAKGEDTSIITVPRDNKDFFNSFWTVVARKRNNLNLNISHITVSPYNFVILEALNMFPERNIPLMVNVTTASKIIYSIAGNSNVKINPDILYDSNEELNSHYPRPNVETRYKILDVEYQSFLFDESIESSEIRFEDLSDPHAINMINDQYFKDNPIDILRL